MSFCKCDIIIQFAVHLNDCNRMKNLYNWIVFISSNGFFTGRRYELRNHYMLLHYYDEMSIQLWPVELSMVKCQKVRNILPTQYHATLGFPVNHIVPISKPKQAIFYNVCLRLIVDVCIYTVYHFFLYCLS